MHGLLGLPYYITKDMIMFESTVLLFTEWPRGIKQTGIMLHINDKARIFQFYSCPLMQQDAESACRQTVCLVSMGVCANVNPLARLTQICLANTSCCYRNSTNNEVYYSRPQHNTPRSANTKTNVS